jgi:nucleoside-diphosphate-sugar epimerase
MNILVTGANGFIGTHLTKSLKDDNNNIIEFNFDTTSKIWYSEDINNEITLNDIDFTEVDMIYHLASPVGVSVIVDNPYITMKDGLDITMKIADISKEYDIPVIYTSSSEVYGSKALGVNEETNPSIDIPELASKQSNGRATYALQKLCGEGLILQANDKNKVVRLFNVSGYGQSVESGMVIPTMINRLLNKQQIEVYNNGRDIRSFIDVKDVVGYLIEYGFTDIKLHEHVPRLLNICNTRNRISMDRLADIICSVVKEQCPEIVSEMDNMHIVLPRNNVRPIKRSPDINILQRSLEYKPKYNLEDIIKHNLEYQLK